MVTAETLKQFRRSHGKAVRIGDTVLIREPETLDLRPFGQLRSWLFGDYPKK